MRLLLQLKSFDGITACSFLYISIIHWQDNSIIKWVVRLLENHDVDMDCHDLTHGRFIQTVFTSPKQVTIRLAVLLAIVNSPHINESEHVNMAILKYCFRENNDLCVDHHCSTTHSVLFLTKLGYSLSNRMKTIAEYDKTCGNCSPLSIYIWELLEFSFYNRDSLITAVRHSCTGIFVNILRYHIDTCEVCHQYSDSATFNHCQTLLQLLLLVNRSTWLSSGTLSFLYEFADHVRSTKVLTVQRFISLLEPSTSGSNTVTAEVSSCSHVLNRLLKCLSDVGLVVYVSRLFVLFASWLLEEGDHKWLLIWLSGLVSPPINLSGTFSSITSQHILPRLLAEDPKLVTILIDLLQTTGARGTVATPVLLAAYLLVSRPPGKNNKNRTKMLATPFPTLKVLHEALGCGDDQIRFDALRLLLCTIQRSPDGSMLASLVELFFEFLSTSLWIQHRPSRKQIADAVSLISTDLVKRMERQMPTGNLATFDYESALIDLAGLLLRGVYPGSPSERLSISLSGLHRLALAVCVPGGDPSKRTDDSRDFGLRLLCTAARLADLLSGRRPQGKSESASCGEAETRQTVEFGGRRQLMARLLIGLSSSYPDDREQALQLVLVTRLAKHMSTDSVSLIQETALTRMACSARPDVSPLASCLLRLTADGGGTQRGPLLNQLLNLVEGQVALAERTPVQGLLFVASQRPFYAALGVLRCLIAPDARVPCSLDNDESHVPDLLFCGGISSIAARLMGLTKRITCLVLPVLSQPSPEGWVPEDADFDDESVIDLGGSTASTPELPVDGVMETLRYPEYLTLCCWRSVRELSLLLGTCLLPRVGLVTTSAEEDVASSGADSCLLSHSMVLDIADFFCRHLLTCRHKGAIESCSTGFLPFCQSLMSARSTCLRKAPSIWLDTILQDLLNDTPSTGETIDSTDHLFRLPLSCLASLEEDQDGGHVYCTTRRSAGLPVFIHDILAAACSATSSGDPLVVSSLQRLLTSAEACLEALKSDGAPSPPEKANIGPVPRCIITVNLARSLFRSSLLAQATSVHIEKAFCLAIDGLACCDWAVRTSCSLLYSTLMERIFGVNRSRTFVNKRNCLSSINFFKRYPRLRDHLARVLTESTTDLELPRVNRCRLFAVLHLFTRLLRPHQVSGTFGAIESIFGPFLIRCARSCDIRIRQSAARALVSLVHWHRLPNLMDTLFRQLETFSCRLRQTAAAAAAAGGGLHLNWLHGLLLQMEQLVDLYSCDCTRTVDSAATRGMTKTPPCTAAAGRCRTALISRLSTRLAWLADPGLVVCPVIRKAYFSLLATAGAGLWEPELSAQLKAETVAVSPVNELRHGTVLLCSQLWVRHSVGLRLLAGRLTQTDVDELVAFLRRLSLPEVRVACLLQLLMLIKFKSAQMMILDGSECLSSFETETLSDPTEEAQPLSLYSPSLDFTGLFDVLHALQSSRSDECGVRYGLELLHRLLPLSRPEGLKDLFAKMMQWARFKLPAQEPAYFVALVRLIAGLSNMICSQVTPQTSLEIREAVASPTAQLTGLLVQISDSRWPAGSNGISSGLGLDAYRAILFALMERVDLVSCVCQLSVKHCAAIIFPLIESLLNFRHPELQRIGCSIVQKLLGGTKCLDLPDRCDALLPSPSRALAWFTKWLVIQKGPDDGGGREQVRSVLRQFLTDLLDRLRHLERRLDCLRVFSPSAPVMDLDLVQAVDVISTCLFPDTVTGEMSSLSFSEMFGETELKVVGQILSQCQSPFTATFWCNYLEVRLRQLPCK